MFPISLCYGGTKSAQNIELFIIFIIKWLFGVQAKRARNMPCIYTLNNIDPLMFTIGYSNLHLKSIDV